MNSRTIVKELETLGTAQNRKVFARHGIGPQMFGVSFGNLKELKKKVKTRHDIALDLWNTGNFDARNFATMIVDHDTIDEPLLDSWVKDLDNYVITDSFAKMAAKTPLARKKMEEWIQSDAEWKGRAGWMLMAVLAMREDELEDSYFEKYIEQIVQQIHGRKNRTRDAMNSALMAIGGRNEHLRDIAIAAARKIGKVDVDHGETGCKTPDAVPYIKRMWDRKKKKKQ
jgi:3-methyladenine DNA glycosylase AlkD